MVYCKEYCICAAAGTGGSCMDISLWAQSYSSERMPSFEQIRSFVASPLWDEFNGWIQKSYHAVPSIEYSCCSGQPGWNVKYKKGSKSLCTLYPEKGRFIALVVVSPKDEPEAELLVKTLTELTQDVYRRSAPMMMGRWMMLRIESQASAEDAQKLIELRIRPPFSA